MPATSTDRLNGLTTSVAVKAPVRSVSTANLTLAGEQSVNGVALVSGDRVLVKDQSIPSENGIYVVSTGSWVRSKDFDGNRDAVKGTLVVSNDGAGSIYYRVTTPNPITIGTTAINFEVVSGVLTQSIIGALLYPQTAAEQAESILPLDPVFPADPVIDIRRYGAMGDGSTDDSAAISNAIRVASRSGNPLRIPNTGNAYIVGSAITIAALAGPLRILGDGLIKYTGAAIGAAITISSTAGYDIDVEGVHFDANNLAARFIRVSNASVSMDPSLIGRAIFRRSTFENGYMASGGTQGSAGVALIGGFSEALFEDCVVRNMSRDTGAGVDGSQGSAGIVVTFSGINAYCRKLTVRGGEIDTVTNNETTGSGNDVDCDGIIFSVPAASSNDDRHVPAVMLVDGVTFRNCKGRSVKSQADGFSLITNCTIIRDLEEAIANAREFDLQRGGGVIKSIAAWLYEKSGGGTTLGTSHAFVTYSPDQGATAANNADGGLRVSDITVFNAIPNAVDVIPFFGIVTNDNTARALSGISFRNVSILGGRIARFLRSAAASAILSVHIEGCEGDITTSLLDFTGGVSSVVKLNISGNKNLGSLSPPLVVLFNNSEPVISGHGNFGFASNLISSAVANELGQILRPALIGGDTAEAHAIATPQTVTLADDASHAFGAVGGYGIGIITSNWGDDVQVVFSHQTNRFVQISPSSTTVSFGTTSNPDVDGDLNIWIDSGRINIKNRLGSSRVFHFTHIGGN